MTSYHIDVFYKNAKLCKQFGFEFVKDNNGCFLQRINNTQAGKYVLFARFVERNHMFEIVENQELRSRFLFLVKGSLFVDC